jgi:glycosyltransferase involved in cell wall biosynthesis
MGKSIPVLWVNSIGTRKPDLRHPSHIKRIIRRLSEGFKRAELKENKLRVLSPLLIPKAQSRIALWLNRKLFSMQVDKELKDMGNGIVEYWCFVPNAVDLVPSGGREMIKIIYYCVDDWTKFHYLDTDWITIKEHELVNRSDFVFAVSHYLEEKLNKISNKNVYYMPHGVEYEKFRAALSITELPQDVVNIKKPIIGFYGNIYPWVNLVLIKELATRLPDWNFVIIGGVFCDISAFDNIDNVHFLGRKEHDKLPGYCAAFDVAIIPYDMNNPRMESVSPVKAREILAAGVPVVAADVPELRQFGDEVLIADSADEWIVAIKKQLCRTDKKVISEKVRNADWVKRVSQIRKIVGANGRSPVRSGNK